MINFYTLPREIRSKKEVALGRERIGDSPKMLGRLAEAMTTAMGRIYDGCKIYLLMS